eukprot:1159257-Pelagomonas_calceolata.AAC.11
MACLTEQVHIGMDPQPGSLAAWLAGRWQPTVHNKTLAKRRATSEDRRMTVRKRLRSTTSSQPILKEGPLQAETSQIIETPSVATIKNKKTQQQGPAQCVLERKGLHLAMTAVPASVGSLAEAETELVTKPVRARVQGQNM